MSEKRSNSDDHVLDRWVKLIGSRWFLLIVSLAALVAGIYFSISHRDWTWTNRFGGVMVVAGLLLTMSPFFSNGIYRSQSSAGTLAGLFPDNTPMVTNIEDKKQGSNVAFGIVVTVFETLANTFGDLLGGCLYSF